MTRANDHVAHATQLRALADEVGARMVRVVDVDAVRATFGRCFASGWITLAVGLFFVTQHVAIEVRLFARMIRRIQRLRDLCR